MSKLLLLRPPHGFQPFNITRGISKPHFTPLLISPSLPIFNPSLHLSKPQGNFLARAIESSATKPSGQEEGRKGTEPSNPPPPPPIRPEEGTKAEYPSGEFLMEEFHWWRSFLVKLRMLFALPWERVKKGSVLSMKLRGQISDQLRSRFTSGLCLPQICENFTKAAYDSRISGIYLQIEPLSCGWGKIDEIRRHILNFKKSGKFIVCNVPVCGEKEYYLACACKEVYVPPSAYVGLYGLSVQSSFLGGVFEKAGIEPEVQRIGKYKSAGDQLSRKSMSKENCEMLTLLLDNVYENWLDTVSSTQGKKKDEIEEFLNSGVFQVERLKEEGWITDLFYDDEVISMLKNRLGQKENLRTVDYSKYSRVRKWTLGLEGGRDQIAIIRASGSISRTRSPLSVPSSGIIGEQLIEKIRNVRGKFSLSKLYERIGYNKEIISRGKYAELRVAEQRPLRPDEAELFKKSTENFYRQFRDKAALSRSMTIDQMEEVAQGRVWNGKDAASRGLVDAIGGLSRAVAIAKHKANIPQDTQVRLVEISRPSPSLPEILSGIGSSIIGLDRTVKELLQDLSASSGGVQARMDGILFERMENNASGFNQIYDLLKDYISSS